MYTSSAFTAVFIAGIAIVAWCEKASATQIGVSMIIGAVLSTITMCAVCNIAGVLSAPEQFWEFMAYALLPVTCLGCLAGLFAVAD